MHMLSVKTITPFVNTLQHEIRRLILLVWSHEGILHFGGDAMSSPFLRISSFCVYHPVIRRLNSKPFFSLLTWSPCCCAVRGCSSSVADARGPGG